jgi:hypothetical protein
MRKLSYTGRKLSDNLRRWLATKIVGLSLSALSRVVGTSVGWKVSQSLDRSPLEKVPTSGLDAEKRRQSFLRTI